MTTRPPTPLDFPDLPRAICSDIDDADIFFADSPAEQAIAKAICNNCPEQEPCLTYALRHDLAGTWGGTSANERKQWRRRNGQSAKAPTAQTFLPAPSPEAAAKRKREQRRREVA